MELDIKFYDGIRCMTCQKVLSNFPIHSIDEKKFVCGRCPLPPSNSNAINKREFAYEALAQFLKFNCIYFDNGCVEKLTPDELKVHEPSCPKKIFKCPIVGNCIWMGLEDEILEHVFSEHKENYLDEYEEFDINTKNICKNYIMEYHNHAFLIILSSDSIFAYFQVKLWGPRKLAVNFNYNFTLCNNDLKDGMDFPKLKVSFEDGETNLDVKSAFKVELATIESLQSENLRCRLSLSKEEVVEEKKKEEISPLNKCILEHLQCPVCFEYMISPIYQCNNGHAVCSECKTSITHCPSCKIEVGDLRNRILEDITQYVLYECKYEGCNHKFYPKDKSIHENKCAFSMYKCFIDSCKWGSDYNTILHHFNESHYELVKQSNYFHAYRDDEAVSEFILKYDNFTFIVHHKLSMNNLYVRVELFGPKDTENVFYYAVTVDAHDSKEKIYMRKKCFLYSDEYDKIEESSLIVPAGSVKQEEDFYVRYRIEIVE